MQRAEEGREQRQRVEQERGAPSSKRRLQGGGRADVGGGGGREGETTGGGIVDEEEACGIVDEEEMRELSGESPDGRTYVRKYQYSLRS